MKVFSLSFGIFPKFQLLVATAFTSRFDKYSYMYNYSCLIKYLVVCVISTK